MTLSSHLNFLCCNLSIYSQGELHKCNYTGKNFRRAQFECWQTERQKMLIQAVLGFININISYPELKRNGRNLATNVSHLQKITDFQMQQTRKYANALPHIYLPQCNLKLDLVWEFLQNWFSPPQLIYSQFENKMSIYIYFFASSSNFNEFIFY